MSQKQLWAPWRMEFLTDAKRLKDDGCVFCALIREKQDKENLILHRSRFAIVIMNKYPYNNGHLMIVPNTHVAEFTKVSAEVHAEMNDLAKHAMKALDEAYKPQGYNLGMNLGTAAGAGIKDHLHLHIVPRWIGDTNFMPVIGEVKAMPQHLSASFEALAAYFRRL